MSNFYFEKEQQINKKTITDLKSQTYNVLIIGSSAREQYFTKKLIDDSNKLNGKVNIYSLITNLNPYMIRYTKFTKVNELDLRSLYIILNIIKKNNDKINFAFIGPENPISLGYTDILRNFGIYTFAPNKYHSQIETSKSFARSLFNSSNKLKKYNISFIEINKDNFQNTETLIKQNFNLKNDELVLKFNGLMGGKGVKVQGIDFDSIDYIINYITSYYDNLINDDDTEKLNNTFLIEKKIYGTEFSLMSLCDGNGGIAHLQPIKDYKRLDNNNMGPNTGSMGSLYSPDNKLGNDNIYQASKINNYVYNLLNNQTTSTIGYTGVLYGSFILTNDNKLKIIEYNCRFGDPECIIALAGLKHNLLTLIMHLSLGNLSEYMKHYKLDMYNFMLFTQKNIIGVYMVPVNYPNVNKSINYKHNIYIDSTFDHDKCEIVYGSVEEVNNYKYSLSSRTLFIFSKTSSILECQKNIYDNITKIHGALKYRTDIGSEFISKYEQSGVSIDNGNKSVKSIQKLIQDTYNNSVLGKHGDFGGQFSLLNNNMNSTNILVASIDGVGTKTVFADNYGDKHAYINLGFDIVGHSINDILVQGADPLFILDYYGTNSLNQQQFYDFIKGVSRACIKYGNIPILGGETAEMSSVYKNGRNDLIGCIIGKKNSKFINLGNIKEGDIVIGIKSVGPHTNGFSLINKIFNELTITDKDDYEYNEYKKIVEILLTPHKSYYDDIHNLAELISYKNIKGMCHVTGGGVDENFKRVLPDNLTYQFNNSNENNYPLPEWCNYLMKNCKGLEYDELKRVFNCGIGFMVIMDEEYRELVLTHFENMVYMGRLKKL